MGRRKKQVIRVFVGDLPIISDAKILESKELLLPQEAADILRVAPRTIYYLVRLGKLEAIKVETGVKIRSSSVRAILEKRDD